MASRAESQVKKSLLNGEIVGIDAARVTEDKKTLEVDLDLDAGVKSLLNMVESMVPKGSLVPLRGARDPNTINILLTGATSFLGTHVLQSLSSDSHVGEIHCVAVRHQKRKGSALKINVNSKIFQHPRDLTLPLFRRSSGLFAESSHKIDVIIHIGAQVSFLEPYAGTLRLANTVSTAVLYAMGSQMSIPLHYLSSAGVASVLGRAESLAPVSITEQHSPSAKGHTQSSDGYAISKWVSELLLERMALERDLPVWIHRPTNIVGDGAPTHDLVGAVPLLEVKSRARGRDELQVAGTFDFVPVEKVTSDLVACVFDSVLSPTYLPPAPNSEQLYEAALFIHHSNRSQSKVPPNELGIYLEKVEGRPFSSLPLDQWLEAAKEEGFPYVLDEYLRGILREGGEVRLPSIT
ncbi:hypothetical protein NUW58_g187 [Xylaria curta]|uniref:Uncharacterized protein n=1 Tax=Xylaria curta TaxID=42375 RepID=A0ACC1PR54_9PEZI|nr:hypothetical protein NUW58_g187 [Xylaria curta]